MRVIHWRPNRTAKYNDDGTLCKFVNATGDMHQGNRMTGFLVLIGCLEETKGGPQVWCYRSFRLISSPPSSFMTGLSGEPGMSAAGCPILKRHSNFSRKRLF
jgi:hypothetical protein